MPAPSQQLLRWNTWKQAPRSLIPWRISACWEFCQNQSIADSNAELAVDLRNQVIEQIKAGRTDKEIIDYMVDRYGDFVLYNPPFKLSTAILWLGPVVLFFVNLRRRRTTVEKTERELTPEERRRADALLRGDTDAKE